MLSKLFQKKPEKIKNYLKYFQVGPINLLKNNINFEDTLLNFLIQDYEIRTHNSCPYIELKEIIQEWLLYKILPSEIFFDGVNYEFNMQVSDNELVYLCIFWNLDGGHCNSVALKLKLYFNKSQLHYQLSMTPESEFKSYDKMWKELYLAKDNGFEGWHWCDETSGILLNY